MSANQLRDPAVGGAAVRCSEFCAVLQFDGKWAVPSAAGGVEPDTPIPKISLLLRNGALAWLIRIYSNSVYIPSSCDGELGGSVLTSICCDFTVDPFSSIDGPLVSSSPLFNGIHACCISVVYFCNELNQQEYFKE